MRSLMFLAILAGLSCTSIVGQTKTPTRSDVQQAALIVNSSLDDYVAIHDNFFAFSFDRITGKEKMNFESYSKQLRAVNGKFTTALKKLANAKSI